MLGSSLQALAWTLALLSLAGSCYLLFLSIVALTFKDRFQLARVQKTRFAVLIPAHNEEALLGQTIESLLNQYYEPELFTIHVIADNCTDETARIARESGVQVHERSDLQ